MNNSSFRKVLLSSKIVFIGLFGLLSSCGDDSALTTIKYQLKSFSGFNLLHEKIVDLDTSQNYALAVALDKGLTVKVILKNTSTVLPANAEDSMANSWEISEFRNSGWFILDYDYQSQSQTFYAEGPSNPHVAIEFTGCGSFDVEIYEGGKKDLTSTKQLSWEHFCNP